MATVSARLALMDTYRTIDVEVGGVVQAEIVVQRSRFLAQACRVESEEMARSFIAETRALHHDARHHCTAFVLGAENAIRRTNDDGEPAGTAGRPILDSIVGRGLGDVAVVVTRWFGGTLLGTGGLARAYGEATSAVLQLAGERDRERWQRVRVRSALASAGELDHRLRQLGRMIAVDYDNEAVFTVAVRDLADLGRIDFEPIGAIWQDG